jgi:hypothetical protein
MSKINHIGAWMCVSVVAALIAKQGEWVAFSLFIAGAWLALNFRIKDTPQ